MQSDSLFDDVAANPSVDNATESRLTANLQMSVDIGDKYSMRLVSHPTSPNRNGK